MDSINDSFSIASAILAFSESGKLMNFSMSDFLFFFIECLSVSPSAGC